MNPLVLSDVHLKSSFIRTDKNGSKLQPIKNASAPSAAEIDYPDSFSVGPSCLPLVAGSPPGAARTGQESSRHWIEVPAMPYHRPQHQHRCRSTRRLFVIDHVPGRLETPSVRN